MLQAALGVSIIQNGANPIAYLTALKAVHTATHPARPLRSRLTAHHDAGSASAGNEAGVLLALLDAEADTEDA